MATTLLGVNAIDISSIRGPDSVAGGDSRSSDDVVTTVIGMGWPKSKRSAFALRSAVHVRTSILREGPSPRGATLGSAILVQIFLRNGSN
jgi:hypothetical protein